MVSQHLAHSGEIRVAVVADVRLYRDGIVHSLATQPDFVLETAATLDETLELIHRFVPDLVLLDMSVVDSFAVLGAITQVPDTRVVAFAVDEVEEDVVACAEAGVVGYVPRGASSEELGRILKAAMRGELICSPRIAARLLERVRRGQPSIRLANHAAVTPRERQVWELLDRGLSNKEIATELSIGVATAKNHVHNLLEKLNVSTRGEAAALRLPALRALPSRGVATGLR